MKPIFLTILFCLSGIISGFAQQSITFTWDGSATSAKSFDIAVTAGKSFAVNWGTGATPSIYPPGTGSSQTVFQAYVYGNNPYNVTIYTSDNATDFTSLDISINRVSALDVSRATALTYLDCSNNQLTSLDVSTNTALTYLSCHDNKIPLSDLKTISDMSNITQSNKFLGTQILDTLDWFTPTATLDSVFNGAGTTYTPVTLNGNPAVEGTDYTILDGEVTFLKFGLFSFTIKNPGIVSNPSFPAEVIAAFNVLQQITFTWEGEASNAKSFTMGVTNGKKFTVDWGNGTFDTYPGIGGNQFIAQPAAYGNANAYKVTITGEIGTNFTLLDISNKGVSALDVRGATALTELYCYTNLLTSLDVSKNTALTELVCYNNQLTSLNVSGATALTRLDCHTNLLTSLDVSANTALTNLRCDGNKIPLIDLKAISDRSNITQDNKRLGTQTLDVLNWSTQTAKIDSVFNGLGTTFTPATLNGATAVLGTDYTISGGIITFLKSGSFMFTIKNPGIVSSTIYPAEVIASFEVTLSQDATLSDLIVSAGTLKPVFTPGTVTYNVTVPYLTDNITITGTANHNSATVVGNGNQALTVGNNSFTVVVTAEDHLYSTTYTVNVRRQSNDATLSALTVSQGTLTPNFASGTYVYNVTVGNAITSLDITAATNHANATLVGDTGTQILTVGPNVFTIIVTAEDDNISQSYTVTVNRLELVTIDLLDIVITSKTYDGSPATAATVVTKPGVTGLGAITNIRYGGSAVLPVNVGTYPVTVDIAEGTRYEAALNFSVGTLAINRAAAVAPASLPQGLEATYGDRFRDVTLPSDFHWPSPSSTVGNASSYPVKVRALYNPDPRNYEDYEVELLLMIHPALPPMQITFPEVATAAPVYDPDSTLSNIGLVNGTGAGTFSWRYPNTVPTVDRTEYEVVFTPMDASNYDYSNVPGWNSRTRTIIRTITLTIIPRDIQVTIEANQTFTYTGLPVNVTATVIVSSLRASGAIPALKYEYYRNGQLQDEAINAGQYEVIARSADVNYKGESAAVGLTIEKAQPVILVNDTVATYTGNPISIACDLTGSYTASGLTQTLKFSYEGVNGTTYGPTEKAPIEIGEYTVHISTPGSVSHLPAEAEISLKIVSGSSTDLKDFKDLNDFKDLKVYPNPVSKNSKLFLEQGEKNQEPGELWVEVYNTNGNLLRRTPITQKQTELRSESAEGIYLYILKSKSGVLGTMKIVVK